MKKILVTLSILSILCITSTSYAVVGGEALMNVQDTAAPTGVVQANRVKDAGTVTTDALTSGIISAGGFVWNTGTSNWDRMYGDHTNGVWTNIKSSIALTFAGTHTPADSYANPTDAINSFSLNGVWNGATWNRMIQGDNTADGETASATGIQSSEVYNKIFNGTTYDRLRSGVITGQVLVDNSSNASSHITTNTTTAVKATAGVLNAMIINTTGTTSTAAFYNIASAGCTGTPASGYAFTLGTSALALDSQIDHTFTLGICVLTAGGAAADISVLYR